MEAAQDVKARGIARHEDIPEHKDKVIFPHGGIPLSTQRLVHGLHALKRAFKDGEAGLRHEEVRVW